MRKTTCKGCGREILLDDDILEISHEAPECETFKALIAKAKAEGIGPSKTEVTYRDETGRRIKPGET